MQVDGSGFIKTESLLKIGWRKSSSHGHSQKLEIRKWFFPSGALMQNRSMHWTLIALLLVVMRSGIIRTQKEILRSNLAKDSLAKI